MLGPNQSVTHLSILRSRLFYKIDQFVQLKEFAERAHFGEHEWQNHTFTSPWYFSEN